MTAAAVAATVRPAAVATIPATVAAVSAARIVTVAVTGVVSMTRVRRIIVVMMMIVMHGLFFQTNSKAGDLCKLEVVNLHRGYHHIHRLFARGANWR